MFKAKLPSLKVCLDCGHQQCFATCVQGCDTCCIYCANSWNPILKSDKHLQIPLKYYLANSLHGCFSFDPLLTRLQTVVAPLQGEAQCLGHKKWSTVTKNEDGKVPRPPWPPWPASNATSLVMLFSQPGIQLFAANASCP